MSTEFDSKTESGHSMLTLTAEDGSASRPSSRSFRPTTLLVRRLAALSALLVGRVLSRLPSSLLMYVHLGYRACHVCTIGGVRCIGGGATTYHFPHNVPTEWPNPNGAPFVGRPSPLPYHPSSDTFPELRTNERHQQDLDDLNTGPGSFDSRRRRTGLNGISIWHGAALFSMPEFFVLDIMHLLWLNVVPQFFELILGRVKGFERERWVLSEEAIDQVSEELLAAG